MHFEGISINLNFPIQEEGRCVNVCQQVLQDFFESLNLLRASISLLPALSPHVIILSNLRTRNEKAIHSLIVVIHIFYTF